MSYSSFSGSDISPSGTMTFSESCASIYFGATGPIDPVEAEIQRKKTVLRMKNQQIASLEAEIQQLIRIQNQQAKQLIQVLSERDQLQMNLDKAHKTFMQIANIHNEAENNHAIRALEGDTPSVSERSDPKIYQGCTFLRAFLLNDEEYYEEINQTLMKVTDAGYMNYIGTSLIEQLQQFVDIQSIVGSVLDKGNMNEIVSTLEMKLLSVIGCKKVVIWNYEKTVKTLYSQTQAHACSPDSGMISECFKTKMNQVYSNPPQHKLYNEEFDAFLLSSAQHVLFCPALNSEGEICWIIEVIDTTDNSGTICLPSANDVIIANYFARVLHVFTIINSVKAMKADKVANSVFNAKSDNTFMPIYQLYRKAIMGIVGCEYLDVYLCKSDENNKLFKMTSDALKDNPETLTVEDAGIAGYAFKSQKIISGAVAKDCPHYEVSIDGICASDAIMAIPLPSTKQSMSGVIVVRKKRNGNIFIEDDSIALKSLGYAAIANFESEKNNQGFLADIKRVIHNQEYFAALLSIAQELSSVLDLDILSTKIMVKAQQFLNADRCSLFLIDKEQQMLWSIVSTSSSKIYVAIGEGIAGTVADTGETINIPDAYEDSRFNPSVDKATGYHTKSILCIPIKNSKNEIIGVTQMINKKNGNSFDDTDVELLSAFNVFCGIALTNATIYQDALKSRKNIDAILNVTISISNSPTFPSLVASITHNAKELLDCKYIWLFSKDKTRNIVYPLYIPSAPNIISRSDISSFCAQTGGTIISSNPTGDRRFTVDFCKAMSITPRSILALPIIDSNNQTTGVFIACNKISNNYFTQADYENAKMFALLAGLSLERWGKKFPAAIIHPEKAIDEIMTAVELDKTELPDHMKLTEEMCNVILSPSFNVMDYTETQNMQFILHFFEKEGLLKTFDIPLIKVINLCRRVSSHYSQVPFHNWNNAISTLQMVVCMLHKANVDQVLSKIDVLALFYASLCTYIAYDNKEFRRKEEALKAAYKSNTPLELYKCSLAISSMQPRDCNILSNLPDAKVREFWIIFRELVFAQSATQNDTIVIAEKSDFSMLSNNGRLLFMKLSFIVSYFITLNRPFDISYQWACSYYRTEGVELDKNIVKTSQLKLCHDRYEKALSVLVQKVEGLDFLVDIKDEIIKRTLESA